MFRVQIVLLSQLIFKPLVIVLDAAAGLSNGLPFLQLMRIRDRLSFLKDLSGLGASGMPHGFAFRDHINNYKLKIYKSDSGLSRGAFDFSELKRYLIGLRLGY